MARRDTVVYVCDVCGAESKEIKFDGHTWPPKELTKILERWQSVQAWPVENRGMEDRNHANSLLCPACTKASGIKVWTPDR